MTRDATSSSSAHRQTPAAGHRREIWRYLRFLGCAPDLAEDLTQETLLRALRGPFEDRGPNAEAAWLRTIARNAYRQHLRRPAGVDLEAAEEVWARTIGANGSDRYVEALRECLGELSGRLRRAVDLRYADDASRDEIARQLEMSSDGVKSLLRRARNLLRGCVERRIA